MSTHAHTIYDEATTRPVVSPPVSSAEEALDWYAEAMVFADYALPPEFGGRRAPHIDVRLWTWTKDGERVERTVRLTA